MVADAYVIRGQRSLRSVAHALRHWGLSLTIRRAQILQTVRNRGECESLADELSRIDAHIDDCTDLRVELERWERIVNARCVFCGEAWTPEHQIAACQAESLLEQGR